MKPKKTSLADLATSLGVSKATVSFVLNGKGDEYHISKGMQEKIHKKAKEMSYVPNFFAKSLRQGKTKTIGLVVADISNAFYAELCKTIQEELYKHGYNVLIVSSNDNLEVEQSLMNELIQRSIDGMIISPCNPIENLIPILRSTHIPVVFTDRPGDSDADFVGINNVKEAEKLVKLFSKKPKRLAILTQHNSTIITIQQRIEGIVKACDNEKIKYDIVNLSSDELEINASMNELIKKGVDSFIPLNNKVALKTLKSLKQLNIHIPKDARIISFDDSEFFSYLTPPISALFQPIELIGSETSLRMLERLKETDRPGKHLMLGCSFIERGSN
ncbi:MAG: LacI family DNA-binding transcriptional regulator [Flavobacteriia bacterium]|nr:LacI family DNA-binding transcriptional regulator [Flavobacteriia bacterium]